MFTIWLFHLRGWANKLINKTDARARMMLQHQLWSNRRRSLSTIQSFHGAVSLLAGALMRWWLESNEPSLEYRLIWSKDEQLDTRSECIIGCRAWNLFIWRIIQRCFAAKIMTGFWGDRAGEHYGCVELAAIRRSGACIVPSARSQKPETLNLLLTKLWSFKVIWTFFEARSWVCCAPVDGLIKNVVKQNV